MTGVRSKNTLRGPALSYPQLNLRQHLADISLSCAGCISKSLEQRSHNETLKHEEPHNTNKLVVLFQIGVQIVLV